MVVEYIRYKVEVYEREALIDAYRKGSIQLNDSEYCLGFEFSECMEEAGLFIVRIKWTSIDEHLNGFRKSEGFKEFYANVKPFFDTILEMKHYEILEIGAASTSPLS